MELIDGYGNYNIGRLKVICEKSGEELKNNPYVELHDVICDYLKGTDWQLAVYRDKGAVLVAPFCHE